MGVFGTLSFVIVVLIVLLIFYALFDSAFKEVPYAANTTANLSYTTATTAPYVSQNMAVEYALQLINRDRENYSLANVSLSSESSAQQHAQSMLQYGYFSHWDIYGMKPYMRYTLLGGNGSVTENIAYLYKSDGIDVLTALQNMEYNFTYNDYACCQNGHRENILNPNHDQVSIGVAYNGTSIYFVEDFINQYISWIDSTPAVSRNGSVILKGVSASGYSLASVQIGYDSPVQPLPVNQLSQPPYDGPYGYGSTVAGVGYSKSDVYYYYTNTTTINATRYATQGQSFDVEFGLQNLIKAHGGGVYTLMIYLTGQNGTFVGSTYSIFVNQNDTVYVPQNI